jgi:hypothetical protein
MVSIVVVLLTDPAPAVLDALTTPVAFKVAMTVPSIADSLVNLTTYGPAPEPLTMVFVQLPEDPLTPESVTSSGPKPVTAWVKDTE